MEQEAVKKKRRLLRTWWFWVLVAVVFVLLVCGGAVLTDWLVYYDEVHAGVSVYGVDLGGMTQEQAVAAVTQLVDSAGPVLLTAPDKNWSVTPADVGRTMDVQGAVAQAMAVSRAGNFFENMVTRFQLFREPRDLPLNGAIDRAKLQTLLDRIALELHIAPQNARLAMEGGKVKVVEGLNGQDVDTTSLATQMEPFFVTLKSATLQVPLVVKEPAVQAVDTQPAQQQAQAMMSAPITLTSHEKQWTVSPEQLASWMDFRTEYTAGAPTFVPYLAEGKMLPFLNSLVPEVNTEPVDARLKSSDRVTVQVIPASNGETFDVTATAKALGAAAAKPNNRTVPVAVTIVEPNFTTAEAKATTFSDQLSSFTTKYVCPPNRQQNVRITTQYSTNVFLAPGQSYNFDRQIGPRTEARGYKLAPGITGPNTLEDVLGGGICQVSTTMFNAVFFAGLKVTERHNHSIYISHYPKGRDATVSGGGKNLRFVNDTDHYIWIKGTSNGITTTISIYGTSDGRKVSYTVGNFYNVKYANPATVTVQDPSLPKGQTKVSDGQTGRQLKTTRLVTLPNGTVIHRDVWTSTWPAYPTTIFVGTKNP